jgi:DNA-binding response OmpR family regulator
MDCGEVKPSMATGTVLLLETEPSLRRVVAASLQQSGLEIIEAGNADEARRQLEQAPPEVFVMELDHPEGENGQLIDAYRRNIDDGAVVLTTTERPKDNWRQRYQPEAVVYKPFDIRVLAKSIRSLLGANQSAQSTSEGVTDGPSDQR